MKYIILTKNYATLPSTSYYKAIKSFKEAYDNEAKEEFNALKIK